MGDKRMCHSILASAAFAALMLCSVSCSEDRPEGVTARAGFSISVQSRSEADPAGDTEIINDWWMAFVTGSGEDAVVMEVISRSEAGGGSAPVESERFELDIAEGSYTVYAFANITPAELKTYSGLEFVKGSAAPAGRDNARWTGRLTLWDKSTAIPMSGRQDVVIRGRVDESFAIEVVRMLAKVEFVFSNASSSDITVNSVSFGPLADGDVPLLPDYGNLGSAPEIYDGVKNETVSYSFEDNPSRTLKVGASDALTGYFYVRESSAVYKGQDPDQYTGHPSGRFMVKVNVSRDGRDADDMYALTEDLTYINRNDYIRIPITFTDYVLSFDVLFYPPIGGYPAVTSEQRGEEYYITLGTPGRFVINPLLRKATETDYMAHGEYTIEVTDISDPGGILEKKPSYDAATGEIIGDAGGNTGTAEVKVRVTVYQTSVVSYTYDRTIHIIRK